MNKPDIPKIPTDNKRDTVSVLMGFDGKEYRFIKTDELGRIEISTKESFFSKLVKRIKLCLHTDSH